MELLAEIFGAMIEGVLEAGFGKMPQWVAWAVFIVVLIAVLAFVNG